MRHPRILRNRAKCLKCGDVIESKHRHDFVWCSCGPSGIAVDGGLDYLKRCGDPEDIEEMSEFTIRESGLYADEPPPGSITLRGKVKFTDYGLKLFREMGERLEEERIAARVREWIKLSDDDLRLRCGELTPGEVRTVRAALKAILS